MKNFKSRSILFIVLLILFSGVYFLIDTYKNSRAQEILNEQAHYLDISYKQGLDRFHIIAKNVYTFIQNDEEFIKILANTDVNNLKPSHDELYENFKGEFARLEMSGVMGIHIILPDNRSLLRMHQETRYGDSLEGIRYMVEYVNEHKTYIGGFEEGRFSHAFREVYPLYDDGVYIGLVEVLFSSTKMQDYTMRAADIHTHFIVNKNVFEVNSWKSNKREPYRQSIEHKDFLFSQNGHYKHKVLEISKKNIIEPLREKIDLNILHGKQFYLYTEAEGTSKVIVFMPIQHFKDSQTVAYLVSYTSSDKLFSHLSSIEKTLSILAVVTLFLYFVIYKLLREKETVINELKYDALTDIYTRKYFLETSRKECKRLKHQKLKFSVVMADIDYFKNVNDTYGHQYGDVVLQEFAAILKNSVRSVDKVARYGGEEFIIFLQTDAENSFNVVEGMRKKVEASEFGDKKIKLTASFGLSQCAQEKILEDIIKRADDALYAAKESGRNQVHVG